VSILGALAIWHIKRRGALLRARLGHPRDLRPLTDEATS
jgi:hypothetical protein